MTRPARRSRRTFLSTTGLTAAGLTIVPRHVLGRGFQPPSDRLNIAAVGVGGRGRQVLANMAGQNLVAMCDECNAGQGAETLSRSSGFRVH